jgi:tRNA pseudouridine38-40 synthase
MNIGTSRIALCIEYQGTNFNGWQAQRSEALATIQEELERAVSQVANQQVRLHCAGRTDRGVHASAQIVHFDTDSVRPLKAWVRGCNALLLPQIRVRWAKAMPAEFHARFSAISRRYAYLIYNHQVRSGLLHSLAHWHYKVLDEQAMHEAAQCLLGELDFSSFRGAGCQSSTSMRYVNHVRVEREGDFIWVDIKANAFLLHMVRNIVGSLFEVGEGLRDPKWLKQVLEQKDRNAAGITASADGLYLLEVDYPDQYELPKSPWLMPFFKGAQV